MSIFSWFKPSPVPSISGGPAGDTGLSALAWIESRTSVPLTLIDLGSFETPEGQVVFLDPIVFLQAADYTAVPPGGGRVIVFDHNNMGRNSKLVLVFSDAPVAGGAHVGTCECDARQASIFTPTTHAAFNQFVHELGPDTDPYSGFFHAFDEPQGGPGQIVTLPDGTPVPYIPSGVGTDNYPVFTLHDTAGNICAIYVDFMGRNDKNDWLVPPGVTVDA